ncbi:MAG TPA: primosomal protein N' [Patescibacteria group bacterium]|nr:primosomal protein N' [Patescibacteria group bacterium]
MRYYEVAPTKIVRANASTFTYANDTPVTIGAFVMIPVGKQTLLGVVIKGVARPDYPTKEISELLDIPPLPLQLTHTAEWMSDYYHSHLATVFQTILPRGLTKSRRSKQRPSLVHERDRTHFLLNKQQQAALDTLRKTDSGTALLHGVTGSGKTTVYIEYAKQMLVQNKSVVVLVPEIALTSQLVAEFQQHFTDVVLAHSKQTEAERHTAWLAVANATTPQVIIGPRSALFLPLKSIGAIIIDEAHEPSYKQDQSPRYSALRVAGVLAKLHEGIVIQGTATPLVSEYFLAKENNRPIIELPERARTDAVAPEITLVDMTKRNSFVRHRFLSDELLSKMQASLDSGEQILIFHNRRGSASTTLCENCGWSAACPRCFIPLTLHSDAHELRCHICAYTEKVPTSCPVCHETDIIHKGIGTKLVESEIRRLFPHKKIMRFDGDTASTETIEHQYQALYSGEAEIIIGTQVVAKGLDLPKLSTVGVIQADAGLSLPDFSSSERTFQLLAQVIGRVGRSSRPTNVIIQSYQPSNPAVQYGIEQNYDAFYKETLATRKRSNFPPFTHLLKLTCTYKTEAAAIRNSKALATLIRTQHSEVSVLGPTPAFYERQRDTYRWQITVKSAKRAQLLAIIGEVPSQYWQYDIDPMNLL